MKWNVASGPDCQYLSMCSSVVSMKGINDRPGSAIALLTRMSSVPNSPTTASTHERMSPMSVTSHATGKAATPRSRTSAAVDVAVARFLSAITTLDPSLANASATPRPMPCPPPVTIATLPSSNSPAIAPALSFARGCMIGTIDILRNPLRDQLQIDRASRAVLDFHRRMPAYEATLLIDAPHIASSLGVGRVLVKAENRRLGLPSFKI